MRLTASDEGATCLLGLVRGRRPKVRAGVKGSALGGGEQGCAEHVEGVAVAEFAGAVLIGEQAGLADGGVTAEGAQPADGDDVFGFGAVGTMVVGAAPVQAQERALLAVDLEGGVGRRRGLADDFADADVAGAADVGPDPRADGQ